MTTTLSDQFSEVFVGDQNLNTTVLNCLTDPGLDAPGQVQAYIVSVFNAFLSKVSKFYY